jgi:hypothetical protein
MAGATTHFLLLRASWENCNERCRLRDVRCLDRRAASHRVGSPFVAQALIQTQTRLFGLGFAINRALCRCMSVPGQGWE